MFIHTNNMVGSKSKHVIYNLTNVITIYLGTELVGSIYLEYSDRLEIIPFETYKDAVVAFQSLGV